MLNPQKNQKGFAAFYITLLIMAVILGIAGSIFISTWGEQKISGNIVKSSQAYYIAEAGIEDALLRLEKDMNWSSPYTFNLGNGSTTVTISDIIGGSRTITSEGNVLNRLRKIAVVYEVSTEKTSFYYGAQVGEGGILMDDGSAIYGNVFSNGNIVAGPNTEITGTAKVAKTGNKIDGATIGNDAYVDICENSNISGTLTSSTTIICSAAEFVLLSEEIATTSFPISQQEIDDWKTEAASGGTISTDYILQGTQETSLGPKKIEGNMIIQDKAKLYIIGTIWVTGTITIQNQSVVRLDQEAYGSLSGVLIGDGVITLQNAAKALGTGEEGSYLLIISTNTSDSALTIQDSFEADILFTPNGWIVIQNTADTREVTGYGIHLKNNAEIIYEMGLEDTSFTSGPGGSWKVTSWKEIE